MTEARWRAAWDLFQQTAELSANQRREFVESAAPDEEVARKVLAMVAALEAPSSGSQGESFRSEFSDWPETGAGEWQYIGQTLGRFEVKAPLARAAWARSTRPWIRT